LAQAWSQLGYDKKAEEEAKKAFDLSANLTREQHLSVEGRYREFAHDFPCRHRNLSHIKKLLSRQS
jgi:hypothetical protein